MWSLSCLPRPTLNTVSWRSFFESCSFFMGWTVNKDSLAVSKGKQSDGLTA